MYTVIYLYRVEQIHAQQFIDINEKASEIYLANGALDDHTYHADNLDGIHGSKGLLDFIKPKQNEVIFFGQSVYRNKSHYEDVIKHVSNDEEINRLYEEMTKIVDMSKVVTATFTTET